MADLGVIGNNSGPSSINLVPPIMFFKTTDIGDSFFNALTLDQNVFSFTDFLGTKESPSQTGFSIKGVTRKDSVVASKIVRLYERLSGKMVREVQSGADGYFEFLDLSPALEFYVVVLDNEPNSIYDAEISDHVFALEG